MASNLAALVNTNAAWLNEPQMTADIVTLGRSDELANSRPNGCWRQPATAIQDSDAWRSFWWKPNDLAKVTIERHHT